MHVHTRVRTHSARTLRIRKTGISYALVLFRDLLHSAVSLDGVRDRPRRDSSKSRDGGAAVSGDVSPLGVCVQ